MAKNNDKDTNVAAALFDGLKIPRDLTGCTLMRGVTDFGKLEQFNLYETGYSFLKVVQMPAFMQKLADMYSSTYGTIVNNYKRILEFEFRGLDGLDNLTSDTMEITNGISGINVINKVNQQSQATVTMQFFEKSGSTITKFHEMFLRGVRDPLTEIKHYNGLIPSHQMKAGYENETFILLYVVTDNTTYELEKAYLLLAAQPTTAEWSMYNSTKGDIGSKEISVEFNCFPVTGRQVNLKAKEWLDWMHNTADNADAIVVDSSDYTYTGLDQIKVTKD